MFLPCDKWHAFFFVRYICLLFVVGEVTSLQANNRAFGELPVAGRLGEAALCADMRLEV